MIQTRCVHDLMTGTCSLCAGDRGGPLGDHIPADPAPNGTYCRLPVAETIALPARTRAPKPSSPCRWTQDGYKLRSHLDTCTSRECPGCEPCTRDDDGYPVSHCTGRLRCTEHLDRDHPRTCPTCIARVRANLKDIVDLSALTLDEAAEASRGIDSEAANLAGPAADHGVFAARRRLDEIWIEQNIPESRQQRAKQNLLADDDEQHPYSVLGRWELMLCEDYGHERRGKVTIASAADYLARQLTHLAQDEDQDWPRFAHEIATCHKHLEEVLHNSSAPETGVPCPSCTADGKAGPALVKHYRDYDTTGAADQWRCPACRSVWTEADYRLRVAGDYVANAPALTASQLQDAYGIQPATLRQWAHRGVVKKRGRDANGRRLYDADQAYALAEKERDGA